MEINMKVLITGIDGYIGVMMQQVLRGRGHEVSGIDTGFYREGWLHNTISALPAIINQDTRNIVIDQLRGYDAVIHLADLSNDPLGQHDPELTFEINHKASVALAKMAKEAGVKRFIYSSSCSAYGIATEDFVKEESVLNPQTAYAKCKVLVEQDLQKLADSNFSPTFMRNATVYGPSPRMRFDLVVNNLSGLAYTTGKIQMTSDGTPWRPLVHILDVCDAFACVLEAPSSVVSNQVLNIGSSEGNYQVKDIAKAVAGVFTGCEVILGTNDSDNRSYRVNFDKIKRLLPNFKCQRTVKTGAEDLKRIFEHIHLTKELFEFRAFTRIKELDYLLSTGQITKNLFWRNI
jgi:nucleoside-diphosphate-sugar epimerase